MSSDFFTNDFPERVKLNGLINGSRYLVGGEIRQWNGPTREVYSPVR